MLKLSQATEGTNTQWSLSALPYYANEDSEGEIALWLDPPFQRGSVWTLEQRQAWIESLLDGLPIPPIIIEEVLHWKKEEQATVPGHEWCLMVIDGRQRTEAILDFVAGKFDVRGENYLNQPIVFQRKFGNSNLPVIRTRLGSMRKCAELYVRLLTTGTAHTQAEIDAARSMLETEVKQA